MALASEIAKKDVRPVLAPWIERSDVPDPVVSARAAKAADGTFLLTVKVAHDRPWRYAAAVAIAGEKGLRYERVEVSKAEETFTFSSKEQPLRVTFDAAADVPVARDGGLALTSVLDDFSALLWVRGTSREVEANRTLALLWRDVVADASVEVLPPLVADAEVSDADLASHDLVVVGGPEDNAVAARMAARGKLPLETGRGYFRWQGKTYARPDEGLAVAFPNPWNPKRVAFLYLANSKVQAWRMLKGWQRGLPSWAIWKEGGGGVEGVPRRRTARRAGHGGGACGRGQRGSPGPSGAPSRSSLQVDRGPHVVRGEVQGPGELRLGLGRPAARGQRESQVAVGSRVRGRLRGPRPSRTGPRRRRRGSGPPRRPRGR